MKRLRDLGLIRGEGDLPASLVEACFEGRLLGGLSLSLRAHPEEVLGPLTHAMGGPAVVLKVRDVKTGPPSVMELEWKEVLAAWRVGTLDELIVELNAFFFDELDVRPLVVLGEWEGMLQVWAVRDDVLEFLLSTRLIDSARNLCALRARFE